MAMVYLLWKNFQVLENPHGMRQILIWGSIFIIMMIGVRAVAAERAGWIT